MRIIYRTAKFAVFQSFCIKAHFHSRKISTDRKFSENVIVKSWRNFSTSTFFSDGKFVSANHILQNFLSAENFPAWVEMGLYAREIDIRFLKKGINFPRVIQNDWKTANFARAILSAFYNISQWNFGILVIVMLFQAVIKWLSRLV
jgi:hypothetical protein